MRRLLRQTTGRVHTPDNVPEKRSGVPEKRSGVPEKRSGLTLMSGRLCLAMRAADRVACSGRSRIVSWRHLVIAMPTSMLSQLKAVKVRGAVLMTALLTGAALPALPVMAQSGASDTASTETSATVQQDRLAPAVRQAVLLDPQVTEATARACQMAHRLGLTRAEGRPKLTATISGSKEVLSRIKRSPPTPGIFSRPHTAAQREIYKTGAHTRDFDHDEKNNIYDAKLTLRYTLFDFGQRRNQTDASVIAFEVAQIDARDVMRTRSHDMLRLALSLRQLDQMVSLQRMTLDQVNEHVANVRARVEAGAGRVVDLREAQLVSLDQEIALNRAVAERDQLREIFRSEFELEVEDASALAQTFIQYRPDTLPVILADRTDKAHALRLRQRQVGHEAESIRGSRLPKLDGVLDGTVFDVTDYEDEYEVVGRIEVTMPLYDGGTARARLRETDWRKRELKSSLDALHRAHARESESLAQRSQQLIREENEAIARRDELNARMRAQQERQGKTVSAPLALARLRAEIGAAEARLLEISNEAELVRARASLVAEQLDSILGLTLGDAAC
ncbi:MAG: hypothetical protein CMM65_01520 [Rhodospirillaceae bacterium]|nr:hypothetical protein [Rhodospirillaceae bacterium]